MTARLFVPGEDDSVRIVFSQGSTQDSSVSVKATAGIKRKALNGNTAHRSRPSWS